MPKAKNELLHHAGLSKFEHEQTRWSNDLINAPIVYINKAFYNSFREIRQNILDTAQRELYDLYENGFCNVWFDYQVGGTKGKRGQSDFHLTIYLYQGESQTWRSSSLEER